MAFSWNWPQIWDQRLVLEIKEMIGTKLKDVDLGSAGKGPVELLNIHFGSSPPNIVLDRLNSLSRTKISFSFGFSYEGDGFITIRFLADIAALEDRRRGSLLDHNQVLYPFVVKLYSLKLSGKLHFDISFSATPLPSHSTIASIIRSLLNPIHTPTSYSFSLSIPTLSPLSILDRLSLNMPFPHSMLHSTTGPSQPHTHSMSAPHTSAFALAAQRSSVRASQHHSISPLPHLIRDHSSSMSGRVPVETHRPAIPPSSMETLPQPPSGPLTSYPPSPYSIDNGVPMPLHNLQSERKSVTVTTRIRLECPPNGPIDIKCDTNFEESIPGVNTTARNQILSMIRSVIRPLMDESLELSFQL